MLGFGWAYGFLSWWTHESGYIRRRVQVGARSRILLCHFRLPTQLVGSLENAANMGWNRRRCVTTRCIMIDSLSITCALHLATNTLTHSRAFESCFIFVGIIHMPPLQGVRSISKVSTTTHYFSEFSECLPGLLQREKRRAEHQTC